MANLRILYKNIANTATSLTASNTNGSLVASNMLTEVKSQVHRSTGNFVIYTLQWSSDQRVNCVSLPCTNLNSGAIVTVTLKNAASTTIAAANKSTTITFDTPTTHTVNDFAIGKFTSLCVYFPTVATTVRSIEISVNAAGITAGFIDCSRIVIGEYWSPNFNFENGINLDISDSSNISRTNAGELVYDRGFIHSKLEFKYALLEDADRDKLISIFKEVGVYKNILVNLFPSDTISSNQNEAQYTIYGKRSNSSISHRLYGFHNHSMEITSW